MKYEKYFNFLEFFSKKDCTHQTFALSLRHQLAMIFNLTFNKANIYIDAIEQVELRQYNVMCNKTKTITFYK